jgi:hypothetical protein
MVPIRERSEFVVLGLTFHKVAPGIYRCERLRAEVHGEYGDGDWPFTFCRVNKAGEREWYVRKRGARLPVRYSVRMNAAAEGLRNMCGWTARKREALKDDGTEVDG